MENKVRTPKKKTLSDSEKITNYETMTHVKNVRKFMLKTIHELMDRMNAHDDSKMENPELEYFNKNNGKLKDMKYGSEEYKKMLEEMKPALDHHYANNRHHPEYHKNGMNDMTLIDLIEMLCDWEASVMRSKNGDIRKSLKINKDRFGISDQLEQILNNTINSIEGEE